MSSTKTSSESQMGSGESDDEFYNVKMQNAASTVTKYKDKKNGSTNKVNSPQRTKVQYDYKFDSSSDDDSDDHSSDKDSNIESKPTELADRPPEEKKKEDYRNDESKLQQNTSKVVEKINEELKSMKNVGGDSKVKVDKSDVTTSVKPVTTTSVGVTTPVVVVPPPMIVPQSHSVMAMGPTGMIVPPAIGLANQNVMISQANMLNLPGNVIRGANAVTGIMGTPMGIANPNLINQGNLVGMTNDLLQLQGNIMGIAAPGNMMQIPAGLCMTGNMIPVQSNLAALQGNLIGAAGNIMANQTILNNQGSIITNSGGVMMNPANVMTVNALMNNQGNLMGNPGNIMLNMNSLVGSQTARMNYPGSLLSGMNSVRNPANISAEIGKNQMNVGESKVKSSEQDWKCGKSQSSSEKLKYTSSKSPSPSDSGDGNDDDDDDENSSHGSTTANVRETTNSFKNDGSFMEMFKKMSEANNVKASSNKDETSSTENTESDTTNVKKPPVMLTGIVGKRRGGRVLKTGLVKKVKKDSDAEEEKTPKDAWAMYMAEVKKYREASCEEEGKTRPLVK